MAQYRAKKSTPIKEEVKKKKERKELNEEQQKIREFVILLVVIVGIIGLCYLATNAMQNKNANTNEVEFNYSEVSVGTILNRPYEKYYVLAYEETDTSVEDLNTLFDNYSKDESHTKIYKCNLSLTQNKDYIAKDGKGNKDAKTIDELSFGKATLLLVENGEIKTYTEGYENIVKILK